MPKLSTTQNGFSAGEWSPLMLGRSDLPRFQQSAETIENAIVLIQGGARRRFGTRFVAEVKDSDERVRLMPFVFSDSQAYILELGDQYARFYTQGTRIEDPPGTPVEFATPWTTAQLPDLEWTQYADTAIVVHPNVVPYRIIRVSNLLWKIQAAPFVVWPSAEIGRQPSTGITLSAASGAITVTAGAASFLASDVGRIIIADVGEARITGVTSSTVVDAQAAGFLATSYLAGEWTLTESPKTVCTMTGTNTKGGAATLTLAAAGWRGSDVGSYVQINDGLVEITAFSSQTVVTGRVREILSSTAAAQSEAWTLEPRTWSATRGYPRAVALHEQRVVFAGTAAEPVTLWGSPTGLIYDLSRGVRDAAGFTQQVFGFDMSTIMHLLPGSSSLIALTAALEMGIRATGDEPLSPTNLNPRLGSSHGASACRPAVVGNDIAFVQRNGLKVRALAYNQDEDAFWSPDLTWEAEHITESGVRELAYIGDPFPQLYGVREDGTLIACALYRQTGMLDHSVLGWSRQVTDGAFESCAAIPAGTEDQLWMVVNRTIGGVTRRYIEIADHDLHTDCTVTGTGAASTTWAGYDHLEGETLAIVGDGISMNPAIVTGGEITTPRAVESIEAGLPYTTTVVLPDIEPQFESFGGAAVSVHEVIVDLVDTVGLEIQGNDQRFFRFGPDMLDAPPPRVTGKKKAPNLGWDGGRITLRQIHPYNWIVRRVIRRYTVNDG